MENRIVNTLASMFHRKPKEPVVDNETNPEQLELDLNPIAEEPAPVVDLLPITVQATAPAAKEVVGLFIAGSGGDTPELHVRYGTSIDIRKMTNPVTVKQIADILLALE